MNYEEELKSEFNAEDGSFLLLIRCDLEWNRKAFSNLTSLMFNVAKTYQDSVSIPVWLANGFWYCDTWVKEWTQHENFPKPESQYHSKSLELLADLSFYLFNQESPYQDN